MPVNNVSFVNAALKLKKLFSRKESPQKMLVVNEIYTAITERSTREKIVAAYNYYFKSKEMEYFRVSSSLDFGPDTKISPHANFTQVDRRKGKPNKDSVGNYYITYKDYYTLYSLTPKDYGALYKDILRFLRALPEVWKELSKLSDKTGDYICFKFAYHIFVLLYHSDSLVVYYYKKSNKALIRKTVVDIFNKHNIVLKRRWYRSMSGFDFKHINGSDSSSHSELIAKCIAKGIMKDPSVISRLSVDKIVEILKNSVKRYAKFTPEEIYAHLYS